MADKNLEILITAKDEASKSFQKLDKQLDSTTKTTKELTKATDGATKEQKENKEVVDKSGDSYETLEDKVSKYIKTAISVGAVIGVAKKVIGVAKEGLEMYNQGQTQLSLVFNTMQNMSESTLATIGGSFDEAKQKIVDFGSTMQNLSGFGAEDLSEGLVKLTQTTGDFVKAQELMTTAMDLARYKGVDLETAVLAMQKAYNGSTKELVSLGFAVDSTANAEQNLAVITNTVQGTWETFAQSADGQTEILTQRTDDLKKSLGEGLSGAVNKVVKYMNENFIPAIQTGIDKTSEWIRKQLESKEVQIVMEETKKHTDDMARSFMDLWDVLEPLLIPVIKLLAQVLGGSLVVAINSVVISITTIVDSMTGFTKNLQELKDLVSGGIVKLFKGDFKGAIEDLAGAVDKVKDMLVAPFKSLYDWASKCIGMITSLISKLRQSKQEQATSNVELAETPTQFDATKAIGGSVYSGNSYLVGEHGREIFTPSSNGYITPSSKLGGNNIVINITGNQLLDEDAGEKIGNMILSKLQNQANLA